MKYYSSQFHFSGQKQAQWWLIVVWLIAGALNLSWGFFAHKEINRLACFTLPDGLFPFYKKHMASISKQAVNPDKRRYIIPEEGARHFIDLDHYGKAPFDYIPRSWKKAVITYSEDSLRAHGILPWSLASYLNRLTQAFVKRDAARIVKLSADLGHYIADASVPLHTHGNYNGHRTGQRGIHALWESRLPELFFDQYQVFTGKATYITDPITEIWQIITESHLATDSVLLFEAQLNKEFPSDLKYSTVIRNKQTTINYSAAYAKAYHQKLSGMVERRLRRAIYATGCFWYTAWVNAGQPDLKDLLAPVQKVSTDSLQISNKTILGRPEPN